jgi:hypothetical protein
MTDKEELERRLQTTKVSDRNWLRGQINAREAEVRELLEWVKLNRVQHRGGYTHPDGICSSCDLIRRYEGYKPMPPQTTSKEIK